MSSEALVSSLSRKVWRLNAAHALKTSGQKESQPGIPGLALYIALKSLAEFGFGRFLVLIVLVVLVIASIAPVIGGLWPALALLGWLRRPCFRTRSWLSPRLRTRRRRAIAAALRRSGLPRRLNRSFTPIIWRSALAPALRRSRLPRSLYRSFTPIVRRSSLRLPTFGANWLFRHGPRALRTRRLRTRIL